MVITDTTYLCNVYDRFHGTGTDRCSLLLKDWDKRNEGETSSYTHCTPSCIFGAIHTWYATSAVYWNALCCLDRNLSASLPHWDHCRATIFQTFVEMRANLAVNKKKLASDVPRQRAVA